MRHLLKINESDFWYESEEETLTEEVQIPLSEDDSKELLCRTRDLLKEKGIDIFLAYGTLLGAVRNGHIIKGDNDLDVYVTNENKLLNCIPFLSENGIKLIRAYPGIEYSFRINERTFIDICILHKLTGNIWAKSCVCLSGCITPKKFVSGESKIELLGSTFKCPSNPEKVLKWWYGKNWLIPQNKKGRYEVLSAKVYKELRWFIKKNIINKIKKP